MPRTIFLKLINESLDFKNSSVVFFQENLAEMNLPVIAWRVIDYIPIGGRTCLRYPNELTINASDESHSFSYQIPAEFGTRFLISEGKFGKVFAYGGKSIDQNSIEVGNELNRGGVAANIYRDGKLLCVLPFEEPDMLKKISFESKLFVKVINNKEISEGEVIISKLEIEKCIEIDTSKGREIEITFLAGGEIALQYK